MPSETDIERRNRALLAFAIVTGIRDKAMTALRLKHIDLQELRDLQDPAEVEINFSKPATTYFSLLARISNRSSSTGTG